MIYYLDAETSCYFNKYLQSEGCKEFNDINGYDEYPEYSYYLGIFIYSYHMKKRCNYLI